ncbi:YjjW family glycine radical enzyme activase [Caproiciproducens sp. NJN-50]|uniref:YjjW family glycine radical enzyme activase n=1 Tax=Acutalibacteraceae TaxID=3082771 RepID=UPI000FFE14C5|nr:MULTISPECIES: YjjW family glycine radical enzyme activase [Acutalibacteraceae]QAT50502.1 YjjW family glycine radical enzyme activase [Caproiciproducens sp. NJN-50]
MTKAPVNRIIPFSTVDGPGSRTSVFLQGCNIACGYCHNPETQRLCNSCGACVPKCPAGALSLRDSRIIWDPSKCVSCDTCIAVCPNRASPKVREMDAGQVMAEVEKNIPFIRGVTVSGGECMLYPQFLTEFCTLAKGRGLSCLLDSNGTAAFSDFPELMKVCDGVMLDVKSWSPEIFHSLTGGDNAAVKENLRFLSSLGKLEEVRIVCLDGHVDTEAAIRGIAEMFGPETIHTRLVLIPFRPFGVKGKYASLSSPSPQRMQNLRELAVGAGFKSITVK